MVVRPIVRFNPQVIGGKYIRQGSGRKVKVYCALSTVFLVSHSLRMQDESEFI